MHVNGNNRGFTLAELMVASGIAVLLTSIATFAFSMAMEVFVRSARLMEAESEMLSAMYSIKSTFAQSVNVVYGGDAAASMASGQPNSYTAREEAAISAPNATLGKIFSTNFNTTATTATPNTFLLALMAREFNTGLNAAGASAPNSRFFGTGIYFQRPGFDKSGALYVDQENNAGSGSPNPGGWVILSPLNATHMFTRFTEFHLNNISVMGANSAITVVGQTDGTGAYTDSAVTRASFAGLTVLSAEVRMIMRYFTKGSPLNFRWCPQANMPGGGGTVTAGCNDVSRQQYYTDLEKKVKVVFTNNAYDRQKYLAERPMGNIYFFKSWAPTSREGL